MGKSKARTPPTMKQEPKGAVEPRLVLIAWRDARFYPETRNEAKLSEVKMAVFRTVGHLISRDETTTIVAAERNDEGDYRDITLIPTGSIEEIRKLSLGPLYAALGVPARSTRAGP